MNIRMDAQRIPESEVDQVTQEESGPVALDVWLDGCPPSNALAPKLKAVVVPIAS